MDEPPNTPIFPCQHCWRPVVTKRKGYGEHLFITNPNSIIATFATYIMPFRHCYNTLVLLFQQSINQMRFHAPHTCQPLLDLYVVSV